MLISIITVNYNNKIGLNDTIKSVVGQQFDDFEHIIIDGLSNDGSKAVIEANLKVLDYWVSEKDGGIYNAMNKGILVSKGEYLLFLNSGDTLNDANVLNDVSKNLQTNKDIYYGDLELIHENYREVKIYPEELSFNYFFNKGHIPHPSSFIKRTLFDDVYLYKEKFKIVSDWDFFLCAICKYNVSYEHISRVISNYSTDGISSSAKFTVISKTEKEQSLAENFPLFIEGAKRLVEYDNRFKLNRFKMLNALEANFLAKKMNSIWLTLLTKLFRMLKK